MRWHKKLNVLSEIPDANYQGYLWVSDETTPDTITKLIASQYEQNGKPANPFIREAFLYDPNKQISISVRHVPGRYLIDLFDLKKLPGEFELTEQKYLANRKIGSRLIFKEIWAPEPDENCEGLPVLRKKATVFCGIEKLKEETQCQ